MAEIIALISSTSCLLPSAMYKRLFRFNYLPDWILLTINYQLSIANNYHYQAISRQSLLQ